VPNEKMSSRRLPQPPDVAPGIVIIAVAGFLGFVALSMAGLFFYLRSAVPNVFEKVTENHFPEPALQKDPLKDLRRFEHDQHAALSSYSWVDRSKGLVRIPIEEAMRIIAARGDRAYDPLDPSAGTLSSGAAAAGNSDGVRP
jgi:hypothetical protein